MREAVDLGGTATEHRGCRVTSAAVEGEKGLFDVQAGGKSWFVRLVRASKPGHVHLSCSCGTIRVCDHGRAAFAVVQEHPRLREWSGMEAAAAAESAAAPPAAPPPAVRREAAPAPARRSAPAVPERWTAWLAALREARRVPAPRAPAAPGRKPVVYLLRVVDGELRVAAWTARELKSGGFAPQRQLGLAQMFRRKLPDLPAEDLGLLAALRRHGEAWDDEIPLPGSGGLAEALLATGRCFAVAPQLHRPLSSGAQRAGALGWQLAADGGQTPALQVEGGGEAALGEPPLYLDEAGACLGPLQLAVPVDVARAFLAGPRVLPEAASRLAKAQAGELAALGVPAPRVLRVVTTPAPAPVPRLLLYSRPVERGMFRDAVLIDGASLSFLYGAHEVAADAGSEHLVEVEGDLVRRLLRRRDDEARAAERLAALGFSPLSESAEVRKTPSLHFDLARTGSLTDRTLGPEPEAWRRFLDVHRPALQAEGWRIELHAGFRHAQVGADRWYATVAPAAGGWFELDLGVEIGAERIDLLPVLIGMLREEPGVLEAAVAAGRDLQVALPDGRRVVLPAARLRRILDVLIEMQVGGRFERGRFRLREALVGQAAGLQAHVDGFAWRDDGALRELARRLQGFDQVEPVAPPAALRAELRPYQREGLAWLQFLRAHSLGGVLADDMGLGKTVQALAHLLVEKAAGRLERPALVVAPTSVVRNWAAEAARFAPDLRVLVLHGGGRKAEFARIGEVDLVLTTYPLILRDEAVLAAQPFHLLILDEAQAIKNARAKVARALRRLDARHRLCLTGTPLENHLGELWAQFDFLMPGVLGDAAAFGRVFRGPIEKGGDGERRSLLARRIRPFVLRRTKAAVAGELPPKTEIVHTVELGGAQRDLYESIRLAVHDQVQKAIAERGLEHAQIVILDALLKLRQACCDPRLVKLEAARGVTESAKMDALLDLLPGLLEDGRRVLLFSQFTSMLALIEAALAERGIAFVKLTGDTRDRQTPIRRFQEGAVPVFLISLKAGGTGLNLTAADAVIHYDPWWNPAAEQQATDRAHRIGQDKPVFVYRLIAAGTVEERIARLQDRKRALAAGLLDGDTRQGASLTRADVEALFAPVATD